MKRYIVTISRDGIDCGDPRPILVEDTRTGEVTQHAEVQLVGLPVVKYDESGLRNGARVWIETNGIEVT